MISTGTWCWFQRSPSPAGWSWLQPPALAFNWAFSSVSAAAEAFELGPVWLSPLCDAHSAVLMRSRDNTTALLYFPLLSGPVLGYKSRYSPPSLHTLATSLCPSKALAGCGWQRKLPLNNCAEAEGAGSNPLSGAQLIITTVFSRHRDDSNVFGYYNMTVPFTQVIWLTEETEQSEKIQYQKKHMTINSFNSKHSANML